MATKSTGYNELIKFVENFISPSIVSVHFDGESIQTGFFVSYDGWVCTCYHGFFLKKKAVVRWNDRDYPVQQKLEFMGSDLLLLKIQSAGEDPVVTVPLPIYCESLPTKFHHDALSLGYAGAGTPGVPDAARLFKGYLNNTYYTERHERLNINGISDDKGNSGAPVFDLQFLRVIAYVRASYKRTKKRSGDALTFTALLREKPELADGWRRACKEFDIEIARHFLVNPFILDLASCPEDFVAQLVAAHATNIIERHSGYKLFQDNRYAARIVERDVLNFLDESPRSLLVVSGTSGSGKTSLLLHLAQQFDPEVFLPVFISCLGIKIRDLLRKMFTTMLPAEHYTFPRLGQFLSRCKNRKWVLIFDGLNECAGFSLNDFRELAGNLCKLATEYDINVKVIFSLRSEFLREYLPGFFFWKDLLPDDADSDFLTVFHRDHNGRPYLDIGRINKSFLQDEKLELQAMYQQYCETGLKPLTTFEQLSEPILKMLDRPFVLDLMMRAYNGAEIPLLIGRSSLMREIVAKTLKNGGFEQDSTIVRVEAYLSNLAAFILSANKDLRCLDIELQNQPWSQGDLLDKLLAGTPFLEREIIKRSSRNENFIKFGADWTFEYFLGQYLSHEWWNQNLGKQPEELLSNLHQLMPGGNGKVTSQHLIVALVFFAEWAVTDGEAARFSFVVTVMNNSKQIAVSRGLIFECLDFFRVTYGFAKNIATRDHRPTFLKRLSDNAVYFNETGIEGLLNYVEYLETVGEYKDALLLLNLGIDRFAASENRQLRARRQLSRALNALLINENDAAIAYADKIDARDLPPELFSKYAFVRGRCHQYREEFDEAKKAFNSRRNGGSLYDYKCEHQIAFIQVVAESDFVGASVSLERILNSRAFGISQEQKLDSSLLRAICLFRIGRYGEAEDEFHEIIRLQIARRNRHRLGTALRALAELHSRKFEYPAAIETIDKSIETLRDSPPLSLASAWDTKANILGLLTGDLEAAYACNEKSLELVRKKEHRATKQWFLQTRALLSALEGNLDTVNKLLEEAGVKNPYEQLLKQFIHLLALHCAGQNTGTDFMTRIRQLQIGFQGLHLVWYPGVLSLIEWAALGITPDKTEIAARFPRGMDVDGIIASYLYARIFSFR